VVVVRKKKKCQNDSEPVPKAEHALVENPAPIQEPHGVEEPKVKEGVEWDASLWGKHKKKHTPVDVAEEVLPASIQEPDGDDLWGSASFDISKIAKKGMKGSPLASPIEGEGEICRVRAKHLFDGDEWKNCNLCRAFVRQVAIQLALSGHTDKGGYGIVDQVLIG